MSSKENPLKFRARRFANFLKILMRNKRGILGLVIIAFFGALAVFAPLLTPFTALGEDPLLPNRALAGQNAAPTWLKYLPAQLGGSSAMSENLRVISNPGLPKLAVEGGDWSTQSTSSDVIGARFEPNVGYLYKVPIPGYSVQSGSLAVTFGRAGGEPRGELKFRVFKEFDYPYSGVPDRFVGNLELLSEGTWHNTTVYNWFTHKNETKPYLDVPVRVRVFIGVSGDKEWTLWPPPYIDFYEAIGNRSLAPGGMMPPKGFAVNTTTGDVSIAQPRSGLADNDYWILARDSRETVAAHIGVATETTMAMGLPLGTNPIPSIFKMMPGRYTFGIEISFLDTGYAQKSVQTTIYVDDFGLDFFGTSFGLLGTDHQGRDLYSQLIYGTRVSLYLGILVAVMSVAIGLVVGLAAGYLGRFADELLMRFNDLLLVLPGLPLLIVLVAVLGASIENLIILMGLLGWNGFARLVRSQVLSLRERPFVEAAKSVGAGTGHIVTRHIMPNVMSLVYISLATSVPGAVTAEAALSWLGFYDPNRMSWGRMLFSIFEGGAVRNWWWVVMPGVFISLLAVSFILLGFALDDILNPKLRMRK